MRLREKQAVFAEMVSKLTLHAAEHGRHICWLELYRDAQRQRMLVKMGKSKTMRSQHLEGLAIDVCLLSEVGKDNGLDYEPRSYRFLGEFWESLTIHPEITPIWGGRFGVDAEKYDVEIGWDPMHFEVRNDRA